MSEGCISWKEGLKGRSSAMGRQEEKCEEVRKGDYEGKRQVEWV